MTKNELFQTMAEENIRKNLPHPITTKWLALQCKVSVYQLNRLFKSHYQQTPMEFIWNQRVKLALAKIESDPRLDLNNVAKECGFRHQSHLSRLFKMRIGVTPSRFRQYCRRQNNYLPQQLFALSDTVP